MHALLLILLGIAAGVLSGMFGIGGGVVIVPALLLLWKLPPAEATGTSLGALLLPWGILGAIDYYKKGNLNINFAVLIGLGILLGALPGAIFAQDLNPVILKRLYGAFLLIVGANFLIRG